MRARRGFTLIELLVVMAIIATLLAIAAPRYFASLDRARDASLRESLFVMREAIDKYYGDTGRYPTDLPELVTRRYLRKVPPDPVTASPDTWILVSPPGSESEGNVYDVRSGAPGNGADGTAYAEW
ncbi:MAG TPA: type II secretion system protein [Rhodocyclaceae bacterium]|nr:type II secretion system protein [Rhodocyclaceae bacterium]